MDQFDKWKSFLGCQVRVTLEKGVPDGRDAVIVEGLLLGFGDAGDVQIRDEMGFVHHCWPMLNVEKI